MALQQLQCADYTCEIVMHQCCHLNSTKSFRRPKKTHTATIWQEEPPIFILRCFFSREIISRHAEIRVLYVCRQEKNFQAAIKDKMYYVLNF